MIQKALKSTFLLLVIILISSVYSFSTPGNGSILGKVIDEKNLEMIAVNIGIEGTNIGTITDFEGKFKLLNLPEGKHTVVFSFVGYETKKIEVIVESGNEHEINVQLLPMSIMAEEVTITAQTRGQISAVNQQLNSQAIINVISTEKLKELPDISAAEAIGRLPGLTVQRDGGEGQKIIVRGFEPKYNTISINGMAAPSTDLNNRSTDLNFVSSEIISGVEVMKANTADKDADGLGGNVNLILKEASPGMKLMADLQTGYSSQINKFGAYKVASTFSNRFFKNKFGVLVSANAESYDRSSDQWENDFFVQGVLPPESEETYIKPWLLESTLKTQVETRKRYNMSLFLDYKTKNSTIKTASFYSGLNRDYYVYNKNYDLDASYLKFQQQEVQQRGHIFSNAIEGKHTIFNTSLDWGIGNSMSQQEQPYNHKLVFRQNSAYETNPSLFNTLPPEEIASDKYVNESIPQFFLYDGTFTTNEAPESETNAWINWEAPFNLTPKIRMSFKTGAKYRRKQREKDSKTYRDRFDNMTMVNNVNAIIPGLEPSEFQGLIGLESFIDPNGNPSGQDFLNGQFSTLSMDYVLNRDLLNNFYDNVGKEYYGYIPTAHIKYDYSGVEEVFATYAMLNMQIGKMITFIPGVRYERTFLKYTAFNGNSIPDDELEEAETIDFSDTTTTNTINNILPQIHLKIKPVKWLDIRLAYTNTLSRPDFNDLAPRMQISSSSLSIKHSGTYLNNLESENFDAIVTMYSPKFGLFTLGAFHKVIDGFIYERNAKLLKGTNMDPANFGLPTSYSGYTISYPLNNPETAYINGFETELQTNFHWLPAPFNGIVLSGNFTLMDSKAKYQETLFVRTANPDFGKPGEPRIIFTNHDTAYVDRMLFQAKYLANVSLGYDLKGFSARISYSYTDNILTKEQRRIDGSDREAKLAFSKWDIQVKQKITERLSVYFNVANLFNEPDAGNRLITGYYNYMEYYGTTVNFGVRFKIY